MKNLSPAEMILARCDALRRADYGFVFDSYHSDSNFRQQFPERNAYVQFGWSSLGKDFKVRNCQIVREEIDGHDARVIFLMQMVAHGELKSYAEMALLKRQGASWRYHHGQKMEEKDWPADPMTLDFESFDKLEPKIVF